jgi:hypothetical protein
MKIYVIFCDFTIFTKWTRMYKPDLCLVQQNCWVCLMLSGKIFQTVNMRLYEYGHEQAK